MVDSENKELLEFLEKMANSKPREVEYRLYYDDTGRVVTYTCEDLPGNYIVVSRQQYAEARSDVLVRDGKLISTSRITQVYRMVKNTSGGVKASKYDINILTDTDYVFWKYEHHEIF